jgi:pimeloyl-ACP methyl ester carboxylesterase
VNSRTKAALKILLTSLLLLLAVGTVFYLQPLWVNDQLVAFKLRSQNVHSNYVAVDGYRIHYLEAAAASGPGIPLLLVHGLGARGEVWAPLIPTLAAQGFHVYAIDLLGFGRSDKPDVDYSMALQQKTVLDFMQAIHLPHAEVIGWSMGGWVALKLALDNPKVVDRLVVFDAAGTYFPPTFDASLFTPTDAASLSVLAGRLSPLPKAPLPAFVVRSVIDLFHRNGWVIHRSMASMERGDDLLDFRLRHITRPTLIVWGAADNLIPPSVGEFMHQQIPNSSLLLVQGCGHLVAAECPQAVLPPVTAFLKARNGPQP